ncbi:MAG: response regulator [Chitinophagaceae bacterium]|nr:MAG: response regulator [Chitinophagaceae bacterium]
MKTAQRELSILLADDDPVDRELFIEGMKETGFAFTVKEVENGEELLQYLSSTTKHPHLIILDLNMPVKDGRETLLELKKSESFRHIPVFILSTSNARFDVELACQTGANLFLVKPHGYQEIVEMLKNLFTLFSKYVATCNF